MRKIKETEVRERLESYDNPTVTDELYDFGNTLVADIVDRTERLETKASSLAAYSLGTITLMASTYTIWSPSINKVGMLLAVVLAFTATVFSVLAITLRRFEGISQNEWFKADVLRDRELLRKFHLITMWGVFNSHEANAEIKVIWIGRAQIALFLASICIVLSLLGSLVRTIIL